MKKIIYILSFILLIYFTVPVAFAGISGASQMKMMMKNGQCCQMGSNQNMPCCSQNKSTKNTKNTKNNKDCKGSTCHCINTICSLVIHEFKTTEISVQKAYKSKTTTFDWKNSCYQNVFQSIWQPPKIA